VLARRELLAQGLQLVGRLVQRQLQDVVELVDRVPVTEGGFQFAVEGMHFLRLVFGRGVAEAVGQAGVDRLLPALEALVPAILDARHVRTAQLALGVGDLLDHFLDGGRVLRAVRCGILADGHGASSSDLGI
jgi:hypothetical protein